MAKKFSFDAAYYRRFYGDSDTRVSSQEQIDVLGGFVAAFLRYLDVPVERVLDVGCGVGLWRAVVEREFPGATYEGVEVSEYLCAQYGWKRASIAEWKPRKRYDLVLCQGVLQYLDREAAQMAVANLAEACRGALYLEALTKEDWDEVADQKRTDGDVYLRSAKWYRRELKPRFQHAGGGVWLSPRAGVPLYELEKG